MRVFRSPGPGLAIAVACGIGCAADVAFAQSNSASQGGGKPEWTTDSEPSVEWVYFPVNPPVLGAEVAVVAASRPSGAPPFLRAFLTEPFFAPLSVRLIHMEGEPYRDRAFTSEQQAHIDVFLSLRSVLAKELYERSERFLLLAPEPRLAAFEALAAAQQPRLEEMEKEAEWLRESMASTDTWNEHRMWRLNRGELKQPREKTYVLEFQVVRAAAYYQAGFSPAQRRLIRELTIEMNETIATKGRSEADRFTFFFSPATSRILRPEQAPAELESLIEHYISDKRRLKDELREIIYETDGTWFEYPRRRRIEELAAAQAAAIDDLEVLAERIRHGLARLPDYPRFGGATRLESSLEDRLEKFSLAAAQVDDDRATFILDRVRKARREAGSGDPNRVAYESSARARSAFELENSDRLLALDREAEAIMADLVNVLPPEESARLNGPADIALREFIERRAERIAYADYDLAAIEPGLSPAQRRLMLASAMMRLRQVMLPPEPQPTVAPGTLLGIDGK